MVEAGVKIIPEGGYYAIPRYPAIDVNGDIRQTIVYKNVMIVGDSVGMFLPPLAIKKDYKIMTSKIFRYNSEGEFDKSTFVGQADTEHREEQPSHLSILDNDLCIKECDPIYDRPCIIFCPAGVYENVHNNTIPANPSNCLHCKTCQIKCPFDNIRWTVPEGGGGPRYKYM